MTPATQTIWLASREYAGFAEAGGVKNVACSLAEGLTRHDCQVRVFLPRYGCVTQTGKALFSLHISIAGKKFRVSFSTLLSNGVEVILVESEVFASKQAVYVYTDSESRTIPGAVRGKGHSDVDLMNILFQKAILAFSVHERQAPDVLLAQDAHTALLPAMIHAHPEYRSLFAHTVLIVTIHNAGAGYRQAMPYGRVTAHLTGLPEAMLEAAVFGGHVEPFLLAARYGSLTTVSPWYASELTDHRYNRMTEGLSGEFEKRAIKVVGITNGIDYHKYDPTDIGCSLLPYAFNPAEADLEGKYCTRSFFLNVLSSFTGYPGMVCHGYLSVSKKAVYFSYHGRIAWQKGLDVLARSAATVMNAIPDARFVILGQGDASLEALLIQLTKDFPGRFVYLCGYERDLARMAVAMADFLVLPSQFEPCGLEDFIGQIYGTIPVAHAVGGLKKIQHGKTGFLYETQLELSDEESLSKLMIALAQPVVNAAHEGVQGIPEYLTIIQNAAVQVRDKCNWDSIITGEYLPLFSAIRNTTA